MLLHTFSVKMIMVVIIVIIQKVIIVSFVSVVLVNLYDMLLVTDGSTKIKLNMHCIF